MPELNNNGLISLEKLKPGERGIVRSYLSESEVQERLRELGIIEGTLVGVKRLAPFGDPMELTVRGYQLSIRRKDASQILVHKQ